MLKNIVPVLYACTVIVILLSFTGKVKLGLMLLTFLIPLQNVMEKFYDYPLGSDINDILIIAILFGLFIFKSSRGKAVFESNSFNNLLFAYALYTYFTLWVGSSFLSMPAPLSFADPRLQNWKNYMLLPVIFMITFNSVQDKKDMRRVILIMLATIFIMNFYTTRQISWMTSWVSRVKLKGTFVWLGANEVASFYAAYTFVLIGLFLFIRRKVLKLVLLVFIMVNFYCIIFIYSRAAYLAAILGLIVIGLAKDKKIIIFLIVALFIWQAIVPKSVIERLQYTEEEGQLDQSAQKRLLYWQASVDCFKQNPIYGVGFNVIHHLDLKADTHNLFLRTLGEQGIIGLFFLLSIMLLSLRKAWMLYRRSKDDFLKGLGLGFSACVISSIVGNFFGDRWTYFQLGAYYWIFLGLVERGNAITNSEVIEKTKNEPTKTKNKKTT